MTHETEVRVPADHPALPGHFPGHPVVPGVLLLDLAIEATERVLIVAVRNITSAKFTSPLRPDEQSVLSIRRRDDGRVDARCSVGARTIMLAVFETET